MKYTVIGRVQAKKLHNELNSLLKKFAEDNGLALEPSNAKFSSFDFTKKITLKLKTQAAMVKEDMQEKLKFQRYAEKFGYDSRLFRSYVKISGVEYQVMGVNPRSYKRPLKIVRVCDLHSFKCNAAFLKSAA